MKLLPVFCIAIFGCKSRTHNEVGAAPNVYRNVSWPSESDEHAPWIKDHSKVRTPRSQATYLFHWTGNKDFRTRPIEVLKGVINAASHQNKTFAQSTSTIGVLSGFGLYLANDPFSSSIFGDTLAIVPIKADNEFAVNKGSDYPLIRSDAWGILYSYSGMLNAKGKRLHVAAVVRNEGLVEWDKLKIINATHRQVDLTKVLPIVLDNTFGWRRLLEVNGAVLKAPILSSDVTSKGKFTSNQLEQALLFESDIDFHFPATPKKAQTDFPVCVRERTSTLQECFGLWLQAASPSLLGATVWIDFPLEQAVGQATELGLVHTGKTYNSITDFAMEIAPVLVKHNPTVAANIRNLVTLRQMILSDLEKEGMSQWIPQ